MDDEINDVWIVEGGGCSIKPRIVKRLGGRPLLSEHPTQFVAVKRQASASSFLLKQMAIPGGMFEARLVRVARLLKVVRSVVCPNLLRTQWIPMSCLSALLMSTEIFGVRNCRCRFRPVDHGCAGTGDHSDDEEGRCGLAWLFSFSGDVER
ncbi:hypothetical protein [Rhizobium sp.]|uniref:hypothetical protein n=1 Tax=Rhizobium sp. TaxID=391 RepID=UPI0028A88E42